LWDAVGNSANKEAKKILSGPHDELTSVAFSPDGRLLAAGSVDNFVQLWSMPDGAARPPLSGDGHDIDSLAFSPDGQVLAGGAGDGTIWLWNLKSGRARFLHGHSRGVISLFFSRDGATLLSASLDSTVRLWDVTRGQTTKTLTLPAPSIAALSPDASLLAITAGNAVQLLDARGGDANSAPLLRTLSGHRSGVTTICFSPDGQTLATGGYDSTVRLWDVAHGKLTSKLKGHGGVARSVAFSPDGLTLATGSDDKTVNLWRMQVP